MNFRKCLPGLSAAAMLLALAAHPACAQQAAPAQQTAAPGDQPEPPRGLLNRLWDPKSDEQSEPDDGKQTGLLNRWFGSKPSAANSNPANPKAVQPAASAAASDESSPGLLNRWFGSKSEDDGSAVVPAEDAKPGMLDRWAGAKATDKIDYSDRPKLNVPKERNLPPPREAQRANASPPANSRTLTRPPAEYLEKVRGADGKISGVRDGEEKKDKFLGLF